MKQKDSIQSDFKKVTFSNKQKFLYNGILIIIPFIILLILEAILTVSNYGNDLSLFKESELYPGYYEINQDVNLRYFSKVQNTSPTNDIFLIEKPDTCYRLFVFGGSTTRGFPYQVSMSFPRILYYRLQDAFPSKRIEVVNLSAAALSSYSYIDMLDEVLKMQPDAILLYGGHNEYYGALGVASVENAGNARWIKKLRLRFIRFRTFQLMQNSFMKFTSIFSKKKTDLYGTLMERIVKDKYIPLNSPLYDKGVRQFEENITEFVQKAGQNNIPVVLSELVCNLNDQPPFKSDTINQSAAINYYNEAQTLENEGKLEKAKETYLLAKDLDLIRFRAPEVYNTFLNRIAAKKKLAIVPMKTYFEKASTNNIPGNELMIDHLHPNIDGYFLMAEAFFNTMKANGLIVSNWETNTIKSSAYYRNNWGFTEYDSMLVDISIKTLKAGWPFKQNQDSGYVTQQYLAKGFVGKITADYYNNKRERNIEDGHIEMATYYAQKELYTKAFKEYLSLIKLHPYLTDLYFDAAKLLIAGQEYMQALNLINSAPNLHKNFNYYFTTGNIEFDLHEYKRAINALEKAYRLNMMNVESTAILIPLYNAYKSIGDKANQDRIFALIQEIMPEFDKNFIYGKSSQNSYAELYEKAKQHIADDQFEQAEELLNEANRAKEMAPSYKLLSMLYIKQKNYAAAYDFCEKSYNLDASDSENLINYINLSILKHDFKLASRLLNELKLLNINENIQKQLQDIYNRKKLEYEQQNESSIVH